MLTVKTLRETLMPLSPQAAIDHWIRVLEKFGDTPDFEPPRVSLTMRSGAQFTGYLINGATAPGSKDRHLLLSLIARREGDDAQDVLYANYNDIETITFFDVDHLLQYLPKK